MIPCQLEKQWRQERPAEAIELDRATELELVELRVEAFECDYSTSRLPNNV